MNHQREATVISLTQVVFQRARGKADGVEGDATDVDGGAFGELVENGFTRLKDLRS